jgi:hypothetical protein
LAVRKFLSLFLNKKKHRVRRNGHDVTIAMYASNQSDHFRVAAFNPYHVISSGTPGETENKSKHLLLRLYLFIKTIRDHMM